MNETRPAAALFSRLDRWDHTAIASEVSRQSNLSNSVVRWNNTRAGVNNPAWQSIIAAGGDATTVFDGSLSDVWIVNGLCRVNWHYSSTPHIHRTLESQGAFFPVGIPTTDAADAITASNRALAKLYAKIRETQTDVQGLSIIGEMRETVRMLKSPLKSLTRELSRWSSDTLKNRKRVDALMTSKRRAAVLKRHKGALREVAAGLHLEVVFGWLPFFRDIAEVAEAASELLERFPKVTLQGRGVVERDRGVTTYPQTFNNYITIDTVSKSTMTTVVRYKVGYDRNANDLSLKRAALAKFGLTASEIGPAIWELTIFSFLADYFGNINHVIDALSVETYGVTWKCQTNWFRAMSLTTGSLNAGRCRSLLTPSQFESCIGDPGRSVATTTTVQRRPVGPLPIPVLEMKVPGMEEVKKLANIAALAAQASNSTLETVVYRSIRK